MGTMRLPAWSLAGVMALAGVSALLARTDEDLDVQAIKQRSADLQAQAQAFVDQVKDRGDTLREEASTVREDGMRNMERFATSQLPRGPAGPIDFDEIVQGAASNAAANFGEAPQLIAFASLSMPPKALRQLIQDTARAGGLVVFRGFPNNSMWAFSQALARVVERQDDFANIGIDPRLFRAFDVQAVPTYIAASSDFDLCAGFSCRTRVPPHDRMTGNVRLEYALDTFAQGHGPGARVAAVGLANLHDSAR